MASKALIILGVFMFGVGYLGYIDYPEACDYPLSLKTFYSATRIVSSLSRFWTRLGGSYVTLMRLSEMDFVTGDGVGVEATTHTFGGVTTTIFDPSPGSKENDRAAIVFYHGGGWAAGSVKLYGIFSRSLAKFTGMKVIFPEYRLAPENPFPAGLEDCISATLDFVEKSVQFGVSKDKILFLGDGTGGNLATTVSFKLANRDEVIFKPCHMTLINPLLQISNLLLPSYRKNAKAPLLGPKDVARFATFYIGLENDTVDLVGPMSNNLHFENFESVNFADQINEALIPERYKLDMPPLQLYSPSKKELRALEKHKKTLQQSAADPFFSPLSATDGYLQLLPDTHILTSEFDVLRDDGLIFFQRMRSLGLDVTYTNMEFAAHGIVQMFGAVKYDKLTNEMMKMVEVLKLKASKC